MFELNGKVAIVTGATKGIGNGVAKCLAEVGANIVVVSRHMNECEATAAEIEKDYGVKALPYQCDVTKNDQIQGLVDAAVKEFGKIDILVNNAGIAVTKPAVDLTEDDWDRVLNTNLRGVFFLAQAVGRQMIEQGFGKIINVASMFGLVGDKNILPYLASKGGVVQMTKGLALEWTKFNVQVNAVAPGYAITAINEEVLNNEKVKKALLGKTPMRRYADTKEIASTIIYLASDEASYVTGSVYSVDGGWTCQ